MRPSAGLHSPRPLPRAGLGLVAAGLFGVFVVLAVVVHGSSAPLGFERSAARALSTPFGISRSLTHSISQEVTPLGAPLVTLVIAVALAVVARRRDDRLVLVLCLVGPAMAMGLAEFVAKPLVGRHHRDALSYPSGHVTVATAVAALVLVLLFRWSPPGQWLRRASFVAAVPLAMSLAVIRLKWHYATDAVGGIALGAAVILAVAAALPGWPRLAPRTLEPPEPESFPSRV